MNASTPAPATCDFSRVILTGFMGAGKTTVGRLLAGRLGWEFADSDCLVETQAGETVGAIFAHRGEAAFREMEAAAIRTAGERDRLILALGGGALETVATREHLSSLPNTLTVFLDAPLETLTARCVAEPGAALRPVLADRDRLEERWKNRLPWYRQAHLTVDTAALSPEMVAENILAMLKAKGHAGIEAGIKAQIEGQIENHTENCRRGATP